MQTYYLMSIDPGMSTGITLWRYSDTEPASRIAAWQVEGGLMGFLRWRRELNGWDWGAYYFGDDLKVPVGSLDIVCEKFTPLQNKGFSLTMESVEPLRIEGALIALGIVPDYGAAVPSWQRPSVMYFAGGSTLAEKKKRLRAWLKENGLYLTGKDVGCKDANDAISSTAHALVWFRKQGHRPTIEKYWPDGD